jgi:hypothetical protein
MMVNKKYLLIATLVLMILLILCACSGKSDVVESNKDIPKVELITKENRHLVGKQEQGTTVKLKEDEVLEFKKEQGQYDYSLPKNNMIKEVVDGQEMAVDSIVEVKVVDNKTPEVMIPNGAMGIFYQEKKKGWECKKGDIIEWSFEKYPISESIMNQSLSIGYIMNGKMNKSESYQDLTGRYSLTAPEDGTYYIYFIGTSSDTISMKEGLIQIKNK